jgi:dolichol-phosphate mannosyltransferase
VAPFFNSFSGSVDYSTVGATLQVSTKNSITSNSYTDMILIDGCSTDKTREIAERAGIEVILDNGMGKGAAMRQIIKNIESDIVLFFDADGSHDPNDIPRLLDLVIKNECDMAVASRMRGGSDELYGTIEEFFRLLGSQIITLAINYRFRVRLTDSQNGFRAIKTSIARDLNLKENITSIEQEMTIKCLKKGYAVKEIASHEYARKHGKSKITVWKVAHRYIWCLLKNIF